MARGTVTAHPPALRRGGEAQAWFPTALGEILVRYRRLPLPALLGTAVIFGVVTLLRAPPPGGDEAWNANRAWALLQTGRAFGSMGAGVFERYEGYWTYFPWLGTALHAVGVWLLGPTPVAMRATSLAFGVLLLTAVYAIGSQTGGRRLGITAAILTSMSPSYFFSTHVGRHDIIVAAFGFVAIGLYLAARRCERGAAPLAMTTLAGLLVGLTLDVHGNGIVYGGALLALLAHDHDWAIASVLRSPRLWSLLAGGCAGIAWFLALHVVPYPQTFLAIGSMGPGAARVPPLLAFDSRLWLISFLETLFLIYASNPWLLPLVVAGLVLLSRRRSAGDQRLLILFAALTLAVMALMRVKIHFYTILLSPVIDLLAASFLLFIFERLSHVRWRSWDVTTACAAVIGATVTGLLVASARHGLAPMVSGSAVADYRQVIKEVGTVIPGSATVMGPQTYWFGLSPDQRYLSWEQLKYYQYAVPSSSVEEAFLALRPDYFVFDRGMEYFIVRDREDLEKNAHYLHLSRTDLDSVLDRYATLVTTISSGTSGDVRIYDMNYDRK